MESKILLAQLRAILERMPDWKGYSPISRDHALWLGQAHALLRRWNQFEAISFQVASDGLSSQFSWDSNIAKILGTLHRAIADLELSVPEKDQVVFAAGEVYSFFRELNKVIESAENFIFIIDPYLNSSVFDHYLNSRKSQVKVRLLLSRNGENVKAALQKYLSQYGNVIEVRKSEKIHDRVVFIDGYVGWVVGQSLKDAAKAKPTYLLPIAPDVITSKLHEYETIWNDANAI
jgi:hypothetical protein